MPGKLILLVEDNQDDEILTLDALRRAGVSTEIEVARDGAEALDYLLPRGVPALPQRSLPKLVILDLKLPKVNGLLVLRRLRADERTRYMPVVVLTSSSEYEDISGSYQNGTNAYVRKSIDFEKFVEAMHCLQHFWIEFNQIPQL